MLAAVDQTSTRSAPRPAAVLADETRRRARALASLAGWLLATTMLGGAGVLPAARLPFRTYSAVDGLASDAVHVLLEDSRGFLWVGTSAGLSRFDGTEFRTYDVTDGLPSARVDELFESSAGELWVLTASGAARLDPLLASGHAFTPVALPGGAHYVDSVYEDLERRVWVGVGSTLYRLDRPGAELAGAPRVELDAGEIGALGFMLPNGETWLATNHGIRRLLADGTRRLYRVIASMDNVGAFTHDAAGRIWIGTGDSIYVFAPEPAAAPAPPDVPLAARARPPRFAGELPNAPGEVVRYHDGPLVSPYVNDIAATARGEVLVAIRGGVLRFRGGGVERLTVEDGLPESAVTAVLEDRDGRVWAGTESRGVARLEPAGFVTYGTADGLQNDRVSSVFEDPEGHLYAVTNGRELQVFDGRRFHDVTPPAVRATIGGWGWNDYTLRDRAGRWWMPTARGLYRYPPVHRPEDLLRAAPAHRWRGGAELPGDDVFRLFEDRRGDVWVSLIASPPLVRFSGGRDAIVVEHALRGGSETGGAPSAFAEDAAGDVWMGFYAGGLARVRDGVFRFFGERDGVPPGFVGGLHVDRAGRLWVATGSGGVARIDQPAAETPAVRRYTTSDGLSTNSTRCVTEDGRGRIYVGHERGIDRLDPATGVVRRFSADDGLDNSVLRTCYAAHDGELWFGTVHGLARLDPTRERALRAPTVLISGLRANGVPYPVPGLGAREVTYWTLPPSDGAVEIDFVGVEVGSSPLRFQYRLEGLGGVWSEPRPARSVVFPRLPAGHYRFEVRAVSAEGLASPVPAAVAFEIAARWWRRPAVQAAFAGLAVLLAWLAYRARVRRLLALERVRMRIASDLHDDVGASLSRIGMLGELARARLASEPDTASDMLGRIGEEARALTDATADIIWAVDPRRDDLGSLVARLRRFAADLLEAKDVRLHVTVPEEADGLALPAEVRRALFLMLKESVHNVAKHSRAREAWLAIEVRATAIVAEVRDDGQGFDAARARDAAESGRRGLPGLAARAAGVGGEARVDSGPEGTRVWIRVPRRAERRWPLA